MPAVEDLKEQRHARAIDREVSPIWHDRFSRLAWRHLPRIEEGLALDVHSGPGRTTSEILARTGPGVRVVGVEPSRAMRDLAKARVPSEWKERVYFKPGDFADIADMPEDTYDLVVCNLVLSEAQDQHGALGTLLSLVKPGGTLLATFVMDRTWSEAENLFAEVLRDVGHHEAVARLRRLGSLRPSGHDIEEIVSRLGVDRADVVIEQERFDLLFRSAREFLFSPLVEYGPLRLWKAILGVVASPQEVFFRFKETIDTYYGQSVFSVTAVAGLLSIRRSSAGAEDRPGDVYWRAYPALHRLFTRIETHGDLGLDFEIDIEDVGSEEPAGAVPAMLDDEDVTTPRFVGATHARTAAAISAEDEAIFALLDQSAHRNEPDAELDALLDQVLEFASEPESDPAPAPAVRDVPAPLTPVAAQDVKRAGETLKRIKALLPPPPEESPPRTRLAAKPPAAAPAPRGAVPPPSGPAAGADGRPRRGPPPPPPPVPKGRKR